jgi:hypothetical protein
LGSAFDPHSTRRKLEALEISCLDLFMHTFAFLEKFNLVRFNSLKLYERRGSSHILCGLADLLENKKYPPLETLHGQFSQDDPAMVFGPRNALAQLMRIISAATGLKKERLREEHPVELTEGLKDLLVGSAQYSLLGAEDIRPHGQFLTSLTLFSNPTTVLDPAELGKILTLCPELTQLAINLLQTPLSHKSDAINWNWTLKTNTMMRPPATSPEDTLLKAMLVSTISQPLSTASRRAAHSFHC